MANFTLLNILLRDNSSKNNIIWATDDYYEKLGEGFSFKDCITPNLVTGVNKDIVKPRILKSLEVKGKRTKQKAEVFTPSWICNAQNNLVDNEWFGIPYQFNKETSKGWETNYEKIKFPKDKTWEDYVSSTRLEITCGEAPYLTSRYDTTSGNKIHPKDRIGFLDRKLRVISENIQSKKDWLDWATIALQSTYGYEWQGDNLLLARKNILKAVMDYHKYVFNETPPTQYLINFAKIISWNIWQMDGLKGVIPLSCSENCKVCKSKKVSLKNHDGIYCKIMDWKEGKSIYFVDLVKDD